MAKERKVLQTWEGVKFQNFPLVLDKVTDGSNIYMFGGRNYSVTGHWGGVEYAGRYRFYAPHLTPEEIIDKVWTLSKMLEIVDIINTRGEKGTVQREYFTLQPYEGEIQYYVAFIGGHYKTTLKGYGRNRNYEEYIVSPGEYEILATTSNQCRSGRFGSSGAMIIAPEPIEVGSEGVF